MMDSLMQLPALSVILSVSGTFCLFCRVILWFLILSAASCLPIKQTGWLHSCTERRPTINPLLAVHFIFIIVYVSGALVMVRLSVVSHLLFLQQWVLCFVHFSLLSFSAVHNDLDSNVCRDVGMEVPNVYNDLRNATLPIWLDDVRCNGSETRIADCSHGLWGRHNCGHSEDVAISCSRKVLFANFTTQWFSILYSREKRWLILVNHASYLKWCCYGTCG